MPDSNNTRVHYVERQFLQTQDFVDEQAYHLSRQRLHSITEHTWGIVSGLKVLQDQDGTLLVQPGVAIDGYGRMLVLPDRQSLPSNAFDLKGSEVLEVYALYSRRDDNGFSVTNDSCNPDGSARGNRSSEGIELQLRAVDQNLTRDPLSVGEQRFPTDFQPPNERLVPMTSDDPAQAWPVFLGQITRQKSKQITYEIEFSGRTYAGLVGEALEAPSGDVRVQLGHGSNTDPHKDRVRFVVGMRGLGSNLPKPTNVFIEFLSMEKDGTTTVNGKTTVHGNIKIDGGAFVFGTGTQRSSSTPELPQPWQIYRVPMQIENPGAKKTKQPVEQTKDQLRIEMDHLGNSEVVIGHWSAEDKKFKPCLTITKDCKVIVHGDLIVENNLIETKKQPDPQVSAAARAFGITAFNMGGNLTVSNLLSSSASTGIAGRTAPLFSQPEFAIATMAEEFRTRPEVTADDLISALSDATLEALLIKIQNRLSADPG
jgi:hypothetical protein